MTDYEKPILDENGNVLKIGVLAAHHCIRCCRISESLRAVGYEVFGNANKIPYGMHIYDNFLLWTNEKQFKANVKLLIDNGVRIIEWQNEPNVPAKWIYDVIKDMNVQDKVKLVSNIHDSNMIRRKMTNKDEIEMFRVSDAVIYVANPIEEQLNQLYNINVPTMVLYNYPTKSMIDNTKIDWNKPRRGLVYEGGINAIGDTQEILITNDILKYRNLFPILKQLVEYGNEVHAYAGNADAYATGQHLGIILHQPTPFNELLQEMTQYKYNLLIFNNKDKSEDQVNYTTANKMWDALAAGLPSLTCWCPEMEKYIRKHKIGLVFNDISEIGNTTHFEHTYNELIENVKIKRQELIMENQIWRSENLYAKLLNLELKSIPENIKQISINEFGDYGTEKLLN